MTPKSRRPGAIHISAPSFPLAPRPSFYRKIAYTFLGLAVVVLLAVLWLTSVRAEVVIKAKREAVKLENTVEVAKTPESGQLPGRVFMDTFELAEDFRVADLAETAATSPSAKDDAVASDKLPDSQVRARGTVKIFNKYSRNQILVATTRLLTSDGKLYRIDKRVEIPPGGEVEVGAYADQTGYAYEIGPSRFTIPGLYEPIQAYIYAQSLADFKAVPEASLEETPTPNADDGRKRVTAADLEKAEKSLLDTVLASAKAKLDERAGLTGWESVYEARVVSKKSNASVGQATDSFLSSLKLEVTAVYFPKEDMQAFIRSRLRERVPEGREIIKSDNGENVTYTIESVDLKTENAVIRIAAAAAYRLSAGSPLLQSSIIAGKSKDEALKILKAVEGVEDAQITIRPGWLSSVPSIKSKIEIKIE